MTQLGDLKNDLQDLATTLAPILGVEIGFVDENCENIAGTGLFQKEQGYNYSFPSLTSQIIKSKHQLFMKSRNASPSCHKCQYKNECKIESTLAIPIKYKDRVKGLWAFIAYNNQQRDILMKNYPTMSLMANQLIRMLEFRFQQNQFSANNDIFFNYLQKLLDLSSKGLIVLDIPTSKIIFNEKAKWQVGKMMEKFSKKLITQTFSYQEPLQNKPQPFQQKIGPKIFQGSFYPVVIDQEVQGVIISLGKTVTETNEREFKEIVGQSPAILKLKQKAETLAYTDATVLLLGETGTGKELFARKIHNFSYRNKGPFIAVNCGAIPENLLEAELFGYEKGAFTGCKPEGKPGLLEEAHTGTVFLDEIADLSLSLQVKILRVLEERQIRRIGGLRLVPLDVRFIAATNQNIKELVSEGVFREDLYWRLNVISLTIPPLRERPQDIILLAKLFLEKYSSTLGKRITGLTPESEKFFLGYSWPGNVRELQSVIYHAIIMESSSFITLNSLPEYLFDLNSQNTGINLDNIEKITIIQALNRYGWSKKGKENAARELGIGIASLYRKIKKYELAELQKDSLR